MGNTDDKAIHDGGRWAFVLIVIATFLPVFAKDDFDPVAGWSWVLYALTAVYVVSGCQRTPWTVRFFGDTGYFVAQALLCGGILWLHPILGFSALMMMPLVSHAVMTFKLRWAAAYSLLLLAFSAAPVAQFGWRPIMQVSLGIGSAMVFTAVFSLAVVNASRARSRAEKLASELEEANSRLKEFAAQAGEVAATRERNRLAREIHDGLGHYLTVINVQLEAARALLATDSGKAAEALLKAETMSRDALEDVRRSVGSLRSEGARSGLPEALNAMASESGLQVEVRVQGTPRPIGHDARHALFRSAQEGITNVRRHSGTETASITVEYRDDGIVALSVSDHGKGCTEDGAGGHGLKGVRERVSLLGGTMAARNLGPAGFELKVEVPA